MSDTGDDGYRLYPPAGFDLTVECPGCGGTFPRFSYLTSGRLGGPTGGVEVPIPIPVERCPECGWPVEAAAGLAEP